MRTGSPGPMSSPGGSTLSRRGLIGNQFAALGAALGCVQADAAMEAVRAAVLAELRQGGRWLLVFDNAEAPGDLRGGGCRAAGGMC